MMESSKQENYPKQISSLRKVLPQIIAVGVKNVLLFSFGMTVGFPTILIPALSQTNSKETFSLGQGELSWIGSLNFLCVPVGCLLSGFLTQPIGRRRGMQLVNIPFLAAWLLFHYATKPWHIYVALGLTGFSGGLMEAPTLTYLAEVTTPNLRGVLASSSTVAIILGTLLEFLLGTFLYWRKVALISGILPIIATILLFFVPESPYWLISKERYQEAQESTAWLRGWVKIEDIADEFRQLREQLSVNKNTSENQLSLKERMKTNFNLYTKKPFLWPFGLVSLTFALGHFSGMTTLQTYAVSIFATFKAPINKYYATILLGIAEVFGCLLSSTLVHFVGKRKMNFFSLTGTCICFFSVASYAYATNVMYLQSGKIEEKGNLPLDNETWIPLTLLIGSAFFTHCGIRILPWMLVGEVYYSQIRATASGFSGAMSYVFGFTANKIFFSMISLITLPGTLWFYSTVCLIGLVSLYFLLPETEGKTLYEITEHFAGRKKLNNKVNNFIRKRKIRRKEAEMNGKMEMDNGHINAGFHNDSKVEELSLDMRL